MRGRPQHHSEGRLIRSYDQVMLGCPDCGDGGIDQGLVGRLQRPSAVYVCLTTGREEHTAADSGGCGACSDREERTALSRDGGVKGSGCSASFGRDGDLCCVREDSPYLCSSIGGILGEEREERRGLEAGEVVGDFL